MKVTTRQDAVTIATYTYGPTGRRIQKVVSHSGRRDGTQYFHYAGQQMIEAREYLPAPDKYRTLAQFIFGTQYVDEPIAVDVNGDDETASDLEDCDPATAGKDTQESS